jgi:transposase-like protein
MLNPEQIQVALNDLLSKLDGLNRVLELVLNSFMKAELSTYLSDQPNNKGNDYRPITGFGISESLSLQVLRDRLNQFKHWIHNIMKEQGKTLN